MFSRLLGSLCNVSGALSETTTAHLATFQTYRPIHLVAGNRATTAIHQTPKRIPENGNQTWRSIVRPVNDMLVGVFSNAIVTALFCEIGVRTGEGPTSTPGSGRIQPRLTKSRTSLELNNNAVRNAQSKTQPTQQVTFVASAQKQDTAPGNSSNNASFALQRSKSSGSHLSLQQQKVPVAGPVKNVPPYELPDVSVLPDQVQVLLRKIAVGKVDLRW